MPLLLVALLCRVFQGKPPESVDNLDIYFGCLSGNELVENGQTEKRLRSQKGRDREA